MSDRRTLFLIDGHAQFFRAYHAIRTSLTSPVTHEPTNMTYGFVSTLLKMLRDYRPDYVAVAIDVSGDRESFRSEIYPEYKANREPPPEDFRPQVTRCLEILGQMQIPVIGVEGVEADDVIATLARRLTAERDDLEVRIISRDKDLAQLLGPQVTLFDVYKDEFVTPADVFKTEGVRPEHVVEVLALMGDNVDNVPGVAGIGPKTAGQLIVRYGTIANLLEHIDEIRGKRRENIEAARDQLDLSRRLVMLKDDVDVAFDLEGARFDTGALPVGTLAATFRELGFSRQTNELYELTGASPSTEAPGAPAPAPRPVADDFADGLFATLDPDAAPPRDPGDYELVTTAEGLRAWVERIERAGRVAVDVETDGVAAMRANLCGIALATEPKSGAYVPVRSLTPDAHLDLASALDLLRPVLERDDIEKVGHNLKFDYTVLRRHGVTLGGTIFDTMIASYVIDASRSSHALDVLALALLEHTCTPLTDLIGRGSKQKGFDEVALDRAGPYAAEDADIALRLAAVMAPELEATGLRELFDDVEIPLVTVLADLEMAGIRVDPSELQRQRERLGERVDRLRRAIVDEAPPGGAFNPDSPKQLAAVLFNAPEADPPGLGLKIVKRTKTGASTDQEVLERLAGDPDVATPLPDLVLEYRQLTKLLSTYLTSLEEAIHPETKRVHASFNQTVAATGRLSSSDPNLQNIPVRTELGREIRRAFVAEPGHVLITADYSQIELRLLAHLAEDPALVDAFRQGADIHAAVAAEVYGVGLDAVTSEQRNTAKMVNFGIIYGITAVGARASARRQREHVAEATAASSRTTRLGSTRIDVPSSTRCVKQAGDEADWLRRDDPRSVVAASRRCTQPESRSSAPSASAWRSTRSCRAAPPISSSSR